MLARWHMACQPDKAAQSSVKRSCVMCLKVPQPGSSRAMDEVLADHGAGKKGKGAAAAAGPEDDEFDAILAEVAGVSAGASGGGAAAGAHGAEKPLEEMSLDEVQAAIDSPGTSKTRKQKLKQRLKTLQVGLQQRGHL
jgi:hypothetical protein